jgi:hypothetical protein
MEAFFGSLDLSRPEVARDALLEFVPVLSQQYGDDVATIAADWYDELRAASGASGRFRALTAPSVPAEAVAANVRYMAGNLWTPNPAAMLGPLLMATDKYVKQPGRDTMAANAKREGVRFARVPTGKTTCAFCLMMASRDAVYVSEKSAGSKKFGSGNEFHGHCDCEVVRIAKPSDYPKHYLPDDYYAMYKHAIKDDSPEVRAFLASLPADDKNRELKAAAFSLRRNFPDVVRDGIGRRAVQGAATSVAARESATVAAAPAALAGQALADTITYHSTLHMSDGDLAELMSKHADDPAVFDKIMDVMDERDAKYMSVDTRSTGAQVASLAEDPPEPVKLDPSPVTNPAVRKTRNLTQVERASEEYQNYAMAQYSRALDDLNGVLLNAAGKKRARELGQDLELDIFTGSAVTARKYASEELLRWWEEQGRETLGSFRYKMYGWDTDRKAAQTVRNMGYERGQAFRDRSTF